MGKAMMIVAKAIQSHGSRIEIEVAIGD